MSADFDLFTMPPVQQAHTAANDRNGRFVAYAAAAVSTVGALAKAAASAITRPGSLASETLDGASDGDEEWVLRVRKLTGDPHVPAGVLTIRAKVPSHEHPYETDSELPVPPPGAAVVGAIPSEGVLAYVGHRRPAWRENLLCTLDSGDFVVHWPDGLTQHYVARADLLG